MTRGVSPERSVDARPREEVGSEAPVDAERLACHVRRALPERQLMMRVIIIMMRVIIPR